MSDVQSLRGAPVPMTTEGVGEISSLADALGLCAERLLSSRAQVVRLVRAHGSQDFEIPAR